MYVLLNASNNFKISNAGFGQKGLFSRIKQFVTTTVDAIKRFFGKKTDDNPVLEIALCDLAAGATMAVNGTGLIVVSPWVYGVAIAASAGATSFGCALLNKNVL